MVNKLDRMHLKRGQLVVFQQDSAYLGRVEAMPGDTVLLEGEPYILPVCGGETECSCQERSYYLINADGKQTFVAHSDIVGTAVPM